MLGWLKRTMTITLDADWFYRGLGASLARKIDKALETGWTFVTAAFTQVSGGIVRMLQGYHAGNGALARTLPTGAMAFWTIVVLAAYLLLSYLS